MERLLSKDRIGSLMPRQSYTLPWYMMYGCPFSSSATSAFTRKTPASSAGVKLKLPKGDVKTVRLSNKG
jgi:hypothetical protein